MSFAVPEDFDPFGPVVRMALKPIEGRAVQGFEYYAAHFLVGSKLTGGDLPGNIRALAHELKLQHDTGYELGLRHPAKEKV